MTDPYRVVLFFGAEKVDITNGDVRELIKRKMTEI